MTGKKHPQPMPSSNNARCRVPYRRPVWRELADRFPRGRECLASFFALETAEVLAGAKPANLINLVDRRQPCGRNLYCLWQEFGSALLGASGLEVRVLAKRRTSVLLLIYRRQALDSLLARPNVAAFLGKVGYRQPAEREGALQQLKERFGTGEFPHEIGVFLGYPLKDVAGFLGWGRLTFACQGPWKIYGAPEQSLRLAECFQACRCRMAGRLVCCRTAFDCLRTCDPKTFFSTLN